MRDSHRGLFFFQGLGDPECFPIFTQGVISRRHDSIILDLFVRLTDSALKSS